jgi:hypothetical protein
MLESAPRADIDTYYKRAEKCANGNDPSRARTLGWIMNRMEFPERSIPLLGYAAREARRREHAYRELKERALFTLFESHLDTGDWKRAEQVFPEARKRLTPREVSDWYSRIAVAAAATDKGEAMRIWKAVANIDPSELAHLDDLVRAGLGGELVSFYREMAKKMPSSEIPPKALKMIEEK